MDRTMIVEQLGSQEFRMRYDDKRNVFVPTSDKYLGHTRGFEGIYGWIVGYGTPPARHLDVMVPTAGTYSPGDEVAIRIVGCFKRADGDNKFIGVERGRPETTLSELPGPELTMLRAQYPDVRENEAWLERAEADALLATMSR